MASSAVWHLTYEESRARAHLHPQPPPSRKEPDWREALLPQGEQDPKGPDLFTMCPVAFDGNSIAPLSPLRGLAGEEEDITIGRKPG